ncbi:FAD-dependent oxidoreductase [Streptomyces palmae]|uniref:FAD-dependent oxidoreductase n=1 Tax=Streptomyces palmae TaxID=1701085 RepID=A0A4Z0HEH2_9ACTN|nr:FAD-dependent oxidoreductase [Streptomyces palmae]TGB12077.1 FAD-dependent oxidoreductase [Streptomyces palmae]
MRKHITVIGGGFAGLTAAISAAEAGTQVTLYEAHHTLGGRARTAAGAYGTNEGPHALYQGGPHWPWLKSRNLIGPLAPLPFREGTRFRFYRDGALRKVPPMALLRLARHKDAPVDASFADWATSRVGEAGMRAAANYLAVNLFHHDAGLLSAAFVQERLRRNVKLRPEARYVRGGWGRFVERMAMYARALDVRIETASRIDSLDQLPSGHGPVIVATSPAAARRLLDDPSLVWPSGRTVLVDLALEHRRAEPFVIAGLDVPAWLERFTAQDRTLAPAGEELIQAQLPVGPGEGKADGVARAERILDAGFPGWRERTVFRRTAMADGRTGALDLPGTTWRDRPAVRRGDGVYLAGDAVAAPGILSEVSFNSALEAVTLALGGLARASLARTVRAGGTGQ